MPIARTVSTGKTWSRSQSGRVRGDLALGELAHDAAELLLLRGRVEVHGRDGTRGGTVACPWIARPARYAVVRDGDPRDGRADIVAAVPRGRRPAGADSVRRAREIDAGGFWVGFVAYDAGRAIEHVEPCTPTTRPTRPRRSPTSRSCGSTTCASCRRRSPRRSRRELRPTRRTRSRRTLEPGLEPRARARHVGAMHDADCCGGRVLPGEPHPPAHVRRRARSARALRRARARQPRAARGAVHVRRRAARDVAVVSASPELFLRVDGRDVGDPADQGHRGRRARRFAASAKDRAENVMIVDLARNDLGRVCEFGSVARSRAVRGRGAPRARSTS